MTWGNMELMKVQWDSQQDGIAQDDYDRIKAIITESKYAAETALQGAESFMPYGKAGDKQGTRDRVRGR